MQSREPLQLACWEASRVGAAEKENHRSFNVSPLLPLKERAVVLFTCSPSGHIAVFWREGGGFWGIWTHA